MEACNNPARSSLDCSRGASLVTRCCGSVLSTSLGMSLELYPRAVRPSSTSMSSMYLRSTSANARPIKKNTNSGHTMKWITHVRFKINIYEVFVFILSATAKFVLLTIVNTRTQTLCQINIRLQASVEIYL